MILLLTIIFFVFGLIIGSFLNVVILRLNTQKSFGGRSGCMTCEHTLSWYELIPIISFLGLKGRCLKCKTKISSQYVIVEFITGLIFTLLFLKFITGNGGVASALGGQPDNFFIPIFFITYAFYAVAFSLLIVIAVYDFRHKIIPDALSLILGILAFVGLFFFNSNNSLSFYPRIPSILEFLSGPIIAAPFALFWFVSSGRWMGLGDAKLAIGLGWLLGLSYALSGAVLAFWIGAVVGIMLVIFSKKHSMKSEIPFAPFLILGAVLMFLFELHLFGI